MDYLQNLSIPLHVAFVERVWTQNKKIFLLWIVLIRILTLTFSFKRLQSSNISDNILYENVLRYWTHPWLNLFLFPFFFFVLYDNKRYHEFCIRGWIIIGKKDTCPYCSEKVNIRATLLKNPWEKQSTIWSGVLDTLRYLVVWNPLIVFVINVVVFLVDRPPRFLNQPSQ